MRSHTIAGLAVAAAVLATGAAADSFHQSARSSCIPARIGGRIQCLAVGQRCRPRYEHRYNLYGYTCKRDLSGRYRLRERSFIGPPLP